MPPAIDPYHLPSSVHIKFRRKGSFAAGIGLDEAQTHIRLSGNDSYSFHDLHADSRRRIYLRIKVSAIGFCAITAWNFDLSGSAIHLSPMKFLSMATMAALIFKPLRGEYQGPVFIIYRPMLSLFHGIECCCIIWRRCHMVSGNPCCPRVDRVARIGIPVFPPSKNLLSKHAASCFWNLVWPRKFLAMSQYPS